MAATRKADRLTLSINGLSQAETNVVVSDFGGTSRVSTIGALRENEQILLPFDGSVDDVRIYHAALSKDAVFQLWLFNAEMHDQKLADSDKDGLPDVWEKWWGGEAGVKYLGGGDADRDGFSDLEEFSGMTNPMVKESVPISISFFRTSASVPKAARTFWGDYVLCRGRVRSPIDFRIEKQSGRAQEGTDYLWDREPRTVPRGEDRVVYSLRVVSDGFREADEHVVFKLRAVRGCVVREPSTFSLTITSRGKDSDEDGLPDAWEMEMFGNLKSGERDDPDKDGYSNLREFQRGMKPHIPAKHATPEELMLEIFSPYHSIEELK